MSLNSIVCRILHLSNNVVSLAEEGEPLIQHGLLFVVQIIPIGSAVLWLQRRTCQTPRWVLSCKDWIAVSLSACLSEGGRGHTAVLPGSTVCRIPAHVENDSLDSDQCWAVRIRACCASQSVSPKKKKRITGTSDIPSHLDSSSALMGSYLGGSSLTGTLGEKRLGSSSCSTILSVLRESVCVRVCVRVCVSVYVVVVVVGGVDVADRRNLRRDDYILWGDSGLTSSRGRPINQLVIYAVMSAGLVLILYVLSSILSHNRRPDSQPGSNYYSCSLSTFLRVDSVFLCLSFARSSYASIDPKHCTVSLHGYK